MEGYLIKDKNGNFLSKGLWWYSFDKPEDAYVHSIDDIDIIKEKLEYGRINTLPGGTWSEPVEKIPATWVKDKGVVITGKAESW
jgi:hypothetical protein